MSTISKVFTVLNVVLALFLVGSVASILAQSADYKEKWEQEQLDREKERAELQARIDQVTGEKENLDDANRRLQNQKSDLETENQRLESENASAKNDNTQLRNDITAINSTLQSLQSQLSDEQSRNKDLAEKNDAFRAAATAAEEAKLAAEDDRARLEGELARRDADVAELERQLAALATDRDNLVAEQEALAAVGVPVKEIVGSTVPLIECTVSQVGSGFVVLSVGQNDGVRVGYPFHVYRGGDYIGQVVVDRVYPDNSTAQIHVTNQRGLSFQALDSATTRL